MSLTRCTVRKSSRTTSTDDECRVGVANEAFYALFGTAPEHVQGRPLWDSAPGVWADRNLRARLLAAETVGETPEHPDQVRIRIRDDGIGIAPDLRPKIFDMFIQGDRSLERTPGGRWER